MSPFGAAARCSQPILRRIALVVPAELAGDDVRLGHDVRDARVVAAARRAEQRLDAPARPGLELGERRPVGGQEVRLGLRAQDRLPQVERELLVGLNRGWRRPVDRDLLGPEAEVHRRRVDDQRAEAVADDRDRRISRGWSAAFARAYSDAGRHRNRDRSSRDPREGLSPIGASSHQRELRSESPVRARARPAACRGGRTGSARAPPWRSPSAPARAPRRASARRGRSRAGPRPRSPRSRPSSRRVDEHRLRRDAGQLLDDERGGAEQRGWRRRSPFARRPRRAASAASRARSRSRRPSSSAAQSWSPPPNGTITGCSASIAGIPRPLDEHGDVARRLVEHLADRTARDAFAEQRPAAVEQDEVDLLLRGEPDVVLPGQDARERDRAARRRRARPARARCSSSSVDLVAASRSSSDVPGRRSGPGSRAAAIKLARRLRLRERLGEGEQRVEVPLVLRRDEDRACGHRHRDLARRRAPPGAAPPRPARRARAAGRSAAGSGRP